MRSLIVLISAVLAAGCSAPRTTAPVGKDSAAEVRLHAQAEEIDALRAEKKVRVAAMLAAYDDQRQLVSALNGRGLYDVARRVLAAINAELAWVRGDEPDDEKGDP